MPSQQRLHMYYWPLGFAQPVEGWIWGWGWRICDMHSNWGSLLHLCSIFCSAIYKPTDLVHIKQIKLAWTASRPCRKHERKFNHPLDLIFNQSCGHSGTLERKASKGAFQEECLVTWTLDLWVYKKRLKEASVMKTVCDILNLFKNLRLI